MITYQFDFGVSVAYGDEYYAYATMTSTVPLIFYKYGTYEALAVMMTADGASNIKFYWIKNGVQVASVESNMKRKYGDTYSAAGTNDFNINRILDYSVDNENESVKIFDSYISAKAYIDTGDLSGWLNKPPLIEILSFKPHNDTDLDDKSIIQQHGALISNGNYGDATALLETNNFQKGMRASIFNVIENKINTLAVYLLNEFVANEDELYSLTEPTAEQMTNKNFWIQPYE